MLDAGPDGRPENWIYTRIKHQFSAVAPIGLMEDMNDFGLMGTYHLLIADKVLGDQRRWHELFAERRQQGLHDYIMMDNSLIELGHPLPAPDLVRAVEIVRANTLVLPDSYGNAPETLERSVNGAYEMWDILPDYCSFQLVVQGQTLEEALRLVEEMKLWSPEGADGQSVFDRITHLSVPRVFCDTTGSRKPLIKELYRRYGLPIHLLGFSENVVDDIESAKMLGVTGLDSAMPLWAGMLQLDLNHEPHNPVVGRRRPRDYWMWGKGDWSPEMTINLFRVNQWLGNNL